MAKGNAKRTDPPTELARVAGAGGGLAAPDWLKDYEGGDDKAMQDAMREYRILPRLKLIQAMTKQELKTKFGEGSVILSPGEALVMKNGEKVLFVPVFFFAEFMAWSDRNDKGSQMITERSLDKTSEVALKARDRARRFEPYGEIDAKTKTPRFTRRYIEFLNFPGFIYTDPDDVGEGDPLKGQAVTLSFSKGEFRKGRAYINAVSLRRVGSRTAPLWSQVWSLTPAFRDEGEKKWWGLDFENPEGVSPYIRQEEIEFFKGAHEELKKLYEQKALGVDASDAGEGDEPEVDVEL